MSLAFLFPGQGAQAAGMLRALPRHPAIVATLAEANGELKCATADLDSADALSSTEGSQIALFIAGVAGARALAAESVRPDFVAGMSVGAFAAAVVAGALDFPSALLLVRTRGRLMRAAYPTGHGMAAVVGLNEGTVGALVGAVSTPASPVYLANVNAPDQMVISGADAAIAAVLATARKRGARRTQRLDVTVPSHTPLFRDAAAQLMKVAATVAMKDASIPYLENRGARAITDAEKIRADLAGNLAVAVRWHDMVQGVLERGVRVLVEMPPGATLTDLAKASFPETCALAFERQDVPGLVRSIATNRAG
ncbi:MAG: Malonyl CoA acyl carrier protein transacylase [Verrucomicrobia bacterium]|nr:Malonyl CoA acyl carrier protein transacylase [Verrucomicrobiota bacterium]